jgi:hypothetical protein
VEPVFHYDSYGYRPPYPLEASGRRHWKSQ